MNTIVIGVIAYFAVGWIIATCYMIDAKKYRMVNFDNVFYGLLLTIWPAMVMCLIVFGAFNVLLWMSSIVSNMIVHEKGGAE